MRSMGVPAPQKSSSPTILVVDDETAMRRVLARMLRSEGYEVVEAEDGTLVGSVRRPLGTADFSAVPLQARLAAPR